jgi:hypothetical protein
MKMLQYLQSILTTLGWKEDAKYTAVLAKQLEYLKTKIYDVVYPTLKARQLIPVSNEADPGAESITYQQWDTFGAAQIISNYADDLPLIDALAEDFTTKVKGMGAAYQYSIQDLKRSAMSNTNLPSKKARATRRMVEQKIEDIAANGLSTHGLLGIANNPNVALTSPTTGTWSTATAAQIMADLDKLCSAVDLLTVETYPPTRILLPTALYNIISHKRISTTGDTNGTVLSSYLASSPHVKDIIPWNKLKESDAAGTGPRIIAYTPDPDVLTLEIPQEYEQFPPQPKNLAFVVPTHARCAGVIMPLPMAVGYMDGC